MTPTHLIRKAFVLVVLTFACTPQSEPLKEIPAFLLVFPAGSFAHPVGEYEYLTERNDWRDNWHSVQDFGENRHLGEDWNIKSGGDTDCDEPVYSSADGQIVFAGDAGPGWGSVVIVENTAPNGTKVQSLYGHLLETVRSSGYVGRRELIGKVGSGNGRYRCHLHFEIRWDECPSWGKAGPGYSDRSHGWVDPSEFIDRTR